MINDVTVLVGKCMREEMWRKAYTIISIIYGIKRSEGLKSIVIIV